MSAVLETVWETVSGANKIEALQYVHQTFAAPPEPRFWFTPSRSDRPCRSETTQIPTSIIAFAKIGTECAFKPAMFMRLSSTM